MLHARSPIIIHNLTCECVVVCGKLKMSFHPLCFCVFFNFKLKRRARLPEVPHSGQYPVPLPTAIVTHPYNRSIRTNSTPAPLRSAYTTPMGRVRVRVTVTVRVRGHPLTDHPPHPHTPCTRMHQIIALLQSCEAWVKAQHRHTLNICACECVEKRVCIVA